MKKIIFNVVIVLIILILAAGGVIFISSYSLFKNLTENASISEKVKEIRKKEHYTSLDNISKDYKDAVIAVEDHRYYEHGPVDVIAIIRAIFVNITNQEFKEGGSTISQQTAKNLYFMTEEEIGNIISRKITEGIIAIQLERIYHKDEILELYMNSIYFGNGYYGIYDAAHGYFDKEPKDLDLYESTMLAGLPNAPSVYAPTENFDLTKSRQKKVIYEMLKYEFITEEKANELYKKIDEQTEFKLPEEIKKEQEEAEQTENNEEKQEEVAQ